jgi:hypothetical protein
MSNDTMLYKDGGSTVKVGDKCFDAIIVDADNTEAFDAAKGEGWLEAIEAFAFLLEAGVAEEVTEEKAPKKKGK